jgi:putative flippase GtrA
VAENISRVRHFGGFVLAGLSAMAVDAGILELLTRLFGLNPFAARVISILAAMVVSWAINRWIAFAVDAPPSWREFARFAGASAVSILVNYLVFAAILSVFPGTRAYPSVAIVPASMVSMFVSYAGFRFGAFRSLSRKSRP